MSLSHLTRHLFVATSLIMGTACSTPTPQSGPPVTPAAPAGAVAFKTDVAPLITAKCAGCHSAGGRGSAKVVLFVDGAVSHANTSAEISEIYSAVESGRMPQGKPRLTAAELGILKAWQDAGAPNN